MSPVWRLREIVCAWISVFLQLRVVEVPVLVCCSHMTLEDQPKRLRLAMRIVMQNDGVFVDVILLYISDRIRGAELAPM